MNSNLGFKNICFFFFWPHHAACGILVPWTGIEPGPLALDLQGIPSRTFLYPYGTPNHRGLAKCWEKGMEQITIFFKASICLYFHNGVHFRSIFLRTLRFFVLNLEQRIVTILQFRRMEMMVTIFTQWAMLNLQTISESVAQFLMWKVNLLWLLAYVLNFK